MFHHCRKGGYASSAFTLTFDRPRGGGSDLLPPPLSECAVYGLNSFRREKVSGDPFHGDAGNGGIRLIADKIALCGGN